MEKLSLLIDGLSTRLGRIFSWFTLTMVIVMAAIVVLRYAFQIGSIALQESIIYINALIFTFGVAYTLKEQGHVRVDIFYSRLNEKKRAWVDLLGSLFFLVPSTCFIIWISWDYVAVSWRIREGSAESSGLPFVYLLKAVILVLPALLLLQGISEIAKSISVIKRRNS
ncbi:MAG: TRAP-type mannitol/chloroaromatic compound transport system permease small subunit [Kiritimatiellia bacterium]|jgi:TRAP-type mannitol/chloroaromatic compound transport system permease small subunit